MSNWKKQIAQLKGVQSLNTDLTRYWHMVGLIDAAGAGLAITTEEGLKERVRKLKLRVLSMHEAVRKTGNNEDIVWESLLPEVFALIREVSARVLDMRHFDVQLIAGIGLLEGKLIEMKTGEGKTLSAVLPVCLKALTGAGVHVLTFNDYLAKRDAAWMYPVYSFFGLSVGVVQEGMSTIERKAAYAADVTYATAKEAGFDFLRSHMAREAEEVVQRPFGFAIVDEADSILIDEARVPLVIAGERPASAADPYQVAKMVQALIAGEDWETDEHRRNVLLTEAGIDKVEAAFSCGDLHGEANFVLLTEVNQALHAHVLLQKDVDYIVRNERIEIVDEFTGRVVDDRRWPDGLQEALEAKEGLPIQPGGHILGSIALQNFLKQYPVLAGMTATATPAAAELEKFYDLDVLAIPGNKASIREDLETRIYTHAEAKYAAIVDEIAKQNRQLRPVLVGTNSVRESELVAERLSQRGIECAILNAKNDALEAGIISLAGLPGAVTISTNMAGRGTDIKLGGPDEKFRAEVVAAGGLLVLATNLHESRRIDDQLRGRAGRQGDPGSSQFFVSLEDHLMTTFGIEELIPEKLRPAEQAEDLAHPIISREVARIQRIAEGQNFEIRKTMWRYSQMVEAQRQKLMAWRKEVFDKEAELKVFKQYWPARYNEICNALGTQVMYDAERLVTLHFIDTCWSNHLSTISHIREGIHLVGLGGKDPLFEFHKQIADAFWVLLQDIESKTSTFLETVEITADGIDESQAGIRGPASTWTYLVNDRAMNDLQQMLFGHGSTAFVGLGVIMTWPLLLAWGIWKRIKMHRHNR